MIEIHTHNAVTTITLNRPKKRNALTGEMITGILDGIVAAEVDSACRCLIISGAGGHFAAGRDLGDASADTPLAEVIAYDDAYASIFQSLRRLSKPSVAAVEGYAVAGGFTLSMGCDFVIAARDAQFGALEMRGGFPAAVNTAVLSHLVGPRQALELLLSADTFGAEFLYRLGLINQLADDSNDLKSRTTTFTEKLTALDPLAVKLTKETHRAAMTMPISEALVMAKQLNSLLMTSGKIDDAAEIYAQSRQASK